MCILILQVEEDAFGTYASQGGEKFVYRVKKEGGFGGYKVSFFVVFVNYWIVLYVLDFHPGHST